MRQVLVAALGSRVIKDSDVSTLVLRRSAESLVTDAMTMSNDLVLREAGLRQITSIVLEHQLRLYGHVARLPAEDPAHRILSCRDRRGWTMSRGPPHAPWLRQVESYLKNMDPVSLR